jgi:hypothetical protein
MMWFLSMVSSISLNSRERMQKHGINSDDNMPIIAEDED